MAQYPTQGSSPFLRALTGASPRRWPRPVPNPLGQGEGPRPTRPTVIPFRPSRRTEPRHPTPPDRPHRRRPFPAPPTGHMSSRCVGVAVPGELTLPDPPPREAGPVDRLGASLDG